MLQWRTMHIRRLDSAKTRVTTSQEEKKKSLQCDVRIRDNVVVRVGASVHEVKRNRNLDRLHLIQTPPCDRHICLLLQFSQESD